MTNGHGIETPANKIATAQATLGLAFRLSGEVEEGRITTEIFKRGITVHTGGDGLRISSFPEGTDQNLKDGIFNIVLNALSASALTVDETLDGNPRIENSLPKKATCDLQLETSRRSRRRTRSGNSKPIYIRLHVRFGHRFRSLATEKGIRDGLDKLPASGGPLAREILVSS